MQHAYTDQQRSDAWKFTCEHISAGTPPQQVYDQLIQNGVPQPDAALFVQQALAAIQPQQTSTSFAAPPSPAAPQPVTPPQQPVNAQPQNPPTQKQLDDAWETATSMVGSGISPQTIYEILTENGIPPQTAQHLVQKALKETDPETGEASTGGRDMLIGGLWIAGGLIITIGTYSMASNGGTYFITYGPIIYGVIRFFKGVIKVVN
ncbi:MAG: hypothetical protein IM638_05165 [Bacteroidetes bacterium]|nr:hypothetical protein [Bacteroidota bacterium]